MCKTKPITADTMWLNKEAPLFIKLKLSEDAVCKTNCKFTYNLQQDYAITAINKTDFIHGENIILTFDKTLSAQDTIKMTL